MNRRDFLAAIGATTVISGCTDSEENPAPATPQSSNTDTPEETETNTKKEEESGFELLGLSAPETVELEEWWTWSATIKNHDDNTEVFQSDVLIYHGNGEWENFNEIDFTIPANDKRTFDSPESQMAIPAVARYRIEALDREFQVMPSTKELRYGEGFETSENIIVTIDNVELFNSITDEDGEKFEPEEGEQFGKVQIKLENVAVETKTGIDPSNLFILAMGDEGPGTHVGASRRQPDWVVKNPYQMTELKSNDTITGNVGFEISESFSLEDLSVTLLTKGRNPRWGNSLPLSEFYDNPGRKVSP